MRSKRNRNKKIILLSTLLFCFLLNVIFMNIISYLEPSNNGAGEENYGNEFILRNQDISADNTFTGIGAPWNITHWANRTDKDLYTDFDEGETGILQFPLFSGWDGYKLEADIEDLYDTRNWNNGTFNYGNDNGYSTGADDSAWIENAYQNWTFNTNVVGQGNVMSGNYIDNGETSPDPLGQDCLELRMAGNPYTGIGGQRYWYDQGDRCWWDTTFDIPRGHVINNILKFQVNPIHLISFNSWELRIYINNVRIFSIGIFSLKNMGINTWHDFSIPQGIWTNTTDVFSSGVLDGTSIPFRVSLEYTATSAGYGVEDGENIDYQQILFDNVELETTAETYPSDIGLELNGSSVLDDDWGKGNIELNGNWQGIDNKLDLSFSSDDVGLLGSFRVQLLTEINLFASKNLPESNYETNMASLGTKFTVTNNSLVEWVCYGRVNVPSRYEETLMKVEFPEDIILTAVYDPQNPDSNILDQCDNITAGVLSIPINTISDTPDGFWRFKAKSPNYGEDLIIYSDSTGPWVEDYEFQAGDFVNVTVEISNTPIISSYIQNTRASLSIRFPNGTIWDSLTQLRSVDSNGMVYFDVFQIPVNPPNYEVGLYQAVVTWNNSYSGYGFNESGLIYKNFRVIHDSILTPESYYYEDNYANALLNLKVSFNDFITDNPIENAVLYTYDFISPGVEQYFGEISPGFYFLEFDLNGASFGNNTITIYAESNNYVNKQVDVVIEVIRRTNLNVDDDFLENVQYNSNFTIQVDYVDNGTGTGVDATELYSDWGGDNYFSRISQGRYDLICNASGIGYTAGNLYSFNIYASAYEYESQIKTVRVYITELESQIDLKLNGSDTEPNAVYIVEVSQQVNITIRYRDIFGNHITGATVNIAGKSFIRSLDESLTYNQYTILLNATDLGQGIDNLIVTAEKDNYKPNSIPFIFEIIERQTNYNIIINGIDRTSDPFDSVIVTSQLNITVRYYDILGAHVSEAIVSLAGDYSDNLTEIEAYNQYTILIDTEDLDIGTRRLELTAYRANYEVQSDIIYIQVQRINAEINTTSGSPIIVASPNEVVRLRIELKDLTGSPILGASVNYSWAFGGGSLTDDDNNGVYEVILGNLVEGTYTIIISASLGDNYNFQSYEITLTVIRPPEELLLVTIALISTIIAGIALLGYLILYIRVLKYPKPVRKVRKYRRTLKSKNPPRTSIETREEAVKSVYGNQTADSKRFLKGKPSEEQSIIDKIVKKPTEPETAKDIGGEAE